MNLLGYSRGNWPIVNLGIPLGGSARSKAFLDPILDRCTTKLATWKDNYLSLGGRVPLIKAAVSNLPIYTLSLFKIPKGLGPEIAHLHNKFYGRVKRP